MGSTDGTTRAPSTMGGWEPRHTAAAAGDLVKVYGSGDSEVRALDGVVDVLRAITAE